MTAPVLVLGYGNPSRGDDAVGPLLIDYLSQLNLPAIDLLTDFQLQIEHVLDISDRQLILFIDAGVSQTQPLFLQLVLPDKANNLSTHALSPQQLLGICQHVTGALAPRSYLLAIKASQFELGDQLSPDMQLHYQQACQLLIQMLDNPCPDYWQSLVTS